jgi:amidase
MSFEFPTKEHVQQAAKSLNFTVPVEQEDEYLSLMRHALSCFEVMDTIKVEKPNIKYQRGKLTFPKDSKYNAWYVKSEIIGSRDKNAILFGKTVAVKDNICVAHIPLINGTDFLKDKFTPGMLVDFQN